MFRVPPVIVGEFIDIAALIVPTPILLADIDPAVITLALRSFIYALFILTLLPSTSNGTIVCVVLGFTILNWSTSTINEEDVDESASNLNPATLLPADTFSTYSDNTPESELDTLESVDTVPAKDALFVTTLADNTLIELAKEPDAFEKAKDICPMLEANDALFPLRLDDIIVIVCASDELKSTLVLFT
jgi:hypothetical protein